MAKGATLLRRYLKASGQRAADLSRAANIDKGLLSRWLRDERKPGLSHAYELERITDGAVPAASWVKRNGRAA